MEENIIRIGKKCYKKHDVIKLFDRFEKPQYFILEEAIRILTVWDNIKVLNKPSLNKEFEHFREDNGETKQAITSEFGVKCMIYKMNARNPDGNFQGYICSVCGKWHIGKSRKEPI